MELVLTDLAKNKKLQNKALSIHHPTILSLSQTASYKIIEKHFARAFISTHH